MRPSRFFGPVLASLVFAAAAHAHPGHGGDELTWDFDHLVEHPFATLLCGVVLAAGGYAAFRFASRSRTSAESVRKNPSE
jgi:hypothetical protein